MSFSIQQRKKVSTVIAATRTLILQLEELRDEVQAILKSVPSGEAVVRDIDDCIIDFSDILNVLDRLRK